MVKHHSATTTRARVEPAVQCVLVCPSTADVRRCRRRTKQSKLAELVKHFIAPRPSKNLRNKIRKIFEETQSVPFRDYNSTVTTVWLLPVKGTLQQSVLFSHKPTRFLQRNYTAFDVVEFNWISMLIPFEPLHY